MTPTTTDSVDEGATVDTLDCHRDSGGESNGQPDETGIAGDAARIAADRELKAILESLLFVSSDPLPVARLVSVVGDVTAADVQRSLESLGNDFERDGRGIRLAEIAGGYRLVTKQEYAPWIKRLEKTKSAAKLSRSALETLAIIAYKQPLVRSEIEEIRGVETSGVIRTLLERKLVRIVGRKEVPGRPIMYGTTKFFLEHFGLNDLSQLPPLREFKELGESDQAMLPIEESGDALAVSGATDVPTGEDAGDARIADMETLPLAETLQAVAQM
jgi:segregation and condensation protein B